MLQHLRCAGTGTELARSPATGQIRIRVHRAVLAERLLRRGLASAFKQRRIASASSRSL